MSTTELAFANQPCFTLDRTISSGKSTLILVNSMKDSKSYVLKIFGEDDASIQTYVHEKMIHSSLHHQNIIQYFPNQYLSISKENFQYNLIVMEHAPHGDFFNLTINHNITHNEKLIRTYFHHLIEGLQYLHSRKFAHLDLKLENLLLGEDFLLKIADFDLAQRASGKSPVISSGGTANYRAPEILAGNCQDYYAADIYSIGVCLYTLMAGSFPFIEEEGKTEGGRSLFRYNKFIKDNDQFWKENEELMNGKVRFSKSFRDLVNRMWAENPRERISLKDIQSTRWYNGPVYTEEELKEKVKKTVLKK